MKTKKALSFKQKTYIWSAGLTLQFFSQWLIGVLLVRMSGYEAAGIFSLAMSISNVFAYFANYGMRAYQTSNRNRDFSDNHYILARMITVVFSILSCMVYLAFALGYTEIEKEAVLLYLGYNSINTMSDTLQGAIQIRGCLEFGGYSNALRGISCLVLFIAGFCISDNLIIALCFMMAGTALVTLLYDTPKYRSVVKSCGAKMAEYLDFRRAFCLLCICFPLMLSQTIPVLSTAIPRRLLLLYCGENMLGVYASIFAPTAIITTIISAIVTAVIPSISKTLDNNNTLLLRKWVWIGIALIPLLCAFGAINIFLFGKMLLLVLFNESILQYHSLLYWAFMTAVFSGAIAYYNGILVVIKRLKATAALTIVSLFCTTVGSLFLIKTHGIYGAAFVQLIVLVFQMLQQLIIIHRYIKKRRPV